MRLWPRSVGDDEERLTLLDDVRRELLGVSATDVLDGMHRLGRHGQGLAGADGLRLLASISYSSVPSSTDDFLARVPVPDGRARGDVDAVLKDLATRNAEIVVL